MEENPLGGSNESYLDILWGLETHLGTRYDIVQCSNVNPIIIRTC